MRELDERGRREPDDDLDAVGGDRRLGERRGERERSREDERATPGREAAHTRRISAGSSCYELRTRSAASRAASVGFVPTAMPRASSASFLPCAVPAVPEMIAPAWPIVLPAGASKPAMYATTGFVHVLVDVARRLLLLVAADLADHHDELGLGIGLELLEHVDEARADDRVAADADDRRVADAGLGELVADLVRQRARARDEPDRARA